jgi:cell wall-associated NlpC family hydrolase
MKKIFAIFAMIFLVCAVTTAQDAELSRQRQGVLRVGESLLDSPYGSPPNVPQSFDCSGFIRYVYDKVAGLSLPSTSGGYVNEGERITLQDARPGDILVFTSQPGGSRVNHVAVLYANSPDGELLGTRLIHAVSIPTQSSTLEGNPDTTGVKISEMGKRFDGNAGKEYFYARFLEVRRVLD